MKRLPVVAIVGRPNVGKSSLFNRLIGKRFAIVGNQVGITRDRLIRESDIDNYRVILVDTGGIAEGKGIQREIVYQTQQAIDESDVLVFVVDGREGINPLDLEIASMLRRQSKPVIVAVNKVDEPYMEDYIHDVHRLGFKDVIPISTIHKIGIENLKERIIRYIPDELKEFSKKSFEFEHSTEKAEEILSGSDLQSLENIKKRIENGEEVEVLGKPTETISVAIVGRPNVGKSTLLNTVIGEKRAIVSDVPGTTRDAVDSYVRLGSDNYLFIDTAGIRRRGKIKDIEYYSYVRSIEAVDRADVVVLLISAIDGPTDVDKRIAGIALERFKPIILAVNKTDLLKSDRDWRNLRERMDFMFDFIPFSPKVFISAMKVQGISELLSNIKKLYTEYTMQVRTSDLNRLLKRIMSIHQPPVYRAKIVKIFYGTQVRVKPPTFLLFSNYPEGIPKAFRRFIENKLRENFGFHDIPLRIVFKKR